MHKNNLPALLLALAALVALFGLTACNNVSTTPAPTSTAPAPIPGGPGGGAIINSDSVITAQIQAIRAQTSGYPWELDVLIHNSVDVGTLPNPTKDSVGKVITVKTDVDMSAYKVTDVVTARVKYVGDVPKPGITLYIYNIAPLIPPR